jgi:hypothetical protein
MLVESDLDMSVAYEVLLRDDTGMSSPMDPNSDFDLTF